jgi:hypothetical protein
MCNNSVFQQQRKFNRLAEILGYKYLKHEQLTPRKFEVTFEVSEWQGTTRFYVYFGDTEVTFKPASNNVKSQWYKLN